MFVRFAVSHRDWELLCVFCVKHDSICKKNYRKICERCEISYVSCKSICVRICSDFFLLIIYSCFNSLCSRSWTFDEIRTFFWSLTVRSTIAIIRSTSCLDFANFVVALRFEKNISFRWRIFLIREKQHVSNCSIYKQRKKSEIFFEFCQDHVISDVSRNALIS